MDERRALQSSAVLAYGDIDIGRQLQVAMLSLLIVWHVCAILLGGIVRLGLQVYWVGNFVRILNPAILLLAALMFVACRPRKLDTFALVAGIMVVFGVWSAFLWSNESTHFVSHLFSGLSTVGLYVAAMNQRWDEDVLRRFVEVGAAVILATFTLAIVWFWFRNLTGRTVYLGLPANIVIWPLAYYALSGRHRLAWLSGALILLSGKRTSMIGLVVAVFLLRSLVRWRRRKTLFIVMPIFVGVSLLALLAAAFLFDLASLPVIGAIWSKWAMLYPSETGFDMQVLNRATGQRVGEVILSLDAFNDSVWHWLVGMGYGWTYESPIFYQDSYESHYVHVSPLNYLYQYGLFLAVAFFALLVRKVLWLGKALDADDPIAYTLWITLVGLLVMGLAGYSYAVDPTIWLTLGLLTRVARDRAAGRYAPYSAGGSIRP